jgi:hypothetical protein
MINRAKMPRQLRNKGGITNVTPRTNYFLGGIKDRIRKLIPNEIANVAVKAAPFVAPFNPAVAGLMRGIGRFDQRGSISDAFKQGLGTYAGGQLFRTVGGAGPQEGLGGFKLSSPLSPDRTTAVKDFFSPTKKSSFDAVKEDETFVDRIATKAKGATKTKDVGITSIRDATGLFKDTPILKDLPSIVQQQILVGGVSGAATYIYEAFLKEEPPQQEGETYEEYMARRKENVGRKMKGYFDNYFKFDKDYSSMTDEQKQAFIDRVNVKDGGRIKYQTGGITMANTLAENIRRNIANQASVGQMFQAARDKIAKAKDYAVPVVQGARALLTGAGEPIITNTMRQDLIKRAEAKGGDSGSLGYEDYGLQTSTPGGRFAGGITDIISDPQAFANAATLGRVSFDRDPETGEYSFGDTKYDFTPDPDTGSTGSALLDFINEGGVKAKISDLLTPSTAAAAEPGTATPTPDAGSIITDGDFKYKINSDGSKTLIGKLGEATPTPDAGLQAAYEDFLGIRPGQKYQLRGNEISLEDFRKNVYEPDQKEYQTPNSPTAKIIQPTLPVEPQTDQDLIEGFAKFKEQNPDAMSGAGTMAIVEGTLPDGTPIKFSGSVESNAFNKYLESLGLSRADIVKPRENIESLLKSAKLAKGGMPTGIMKTNKAGVMERDYRDKGGFVPVGIKEKADDVPAMLSKNEFVFTADAVRGAGNGSIEKGAQRMYDTMKNLEKRVV